jgi:hypothetical protein
MGIWLSDLPQSSPGVPQVSGVSEDNPRAEHTGLTAREFYQLHRMLSAMAEPLLGPLHAIPLEVERLLHASTRSGIEDMSASPSEVQWLELLDLAVPPDQFRRYITNMVPDEQCLRLFVRFIASKKAHSSADTRKVEWLLTHLFRLHEKHSLSERGWYKDEIEELLQISEPKPLSRSAEEVLAEFPPLLDEIKFSERFSQLTESRLILRGRELKGRFGEEFFHPLVLAAIVNYNLLLAKKFQRLFDKAVTRLPESSELRETIAANPEKLLQTDYHESISTFLQLGHSESEQEQAQKPESASEPQAAPDLKVEVSESSEQPEDSGPDTIEKRMSQLGIDPARQAQTLREKTRDAAKRFRSAPPTSSTISTISTGFSSMLLADWEINALRQDLSELEDSFRGQFARNISFAVGIVLRIQEELQAYYETHGKGYTWRTHCQALYYLRHEGHAHMKVLNDLITDCKKRGLSEKARQVSVTTAKLEAALQRVGGLSEPDWLVEPLP